MTVKYKTVITKAGAIKLAAATVPNGKKVNFTAMAIGDGGGTLPVPDPNQTKLVNEVWRHALNKISQDKKNKNYVVAELLIPPETGGFWMREMGLYDDTGTLIAVGNMAESYKPALAEGSGRAQTVRMVIMVSDIASVELTIDTSTVMATQDYVDDKIAEHEQSRRHPDATLTAKGFTQLSSATDSTSESVAATPKAVKAAYDLANGKYTAQDATTARKGIVQLSSATDSASESVAATPKAVKAAYDLANGKYTAQDATTAQKGIVQLSSATDSTSEVLAATPKAVSAAAKAIKDTLGTSATKDVVTSKTDTTTGRVLTAGWMSLGGYGTDNLIAGVDALKPLRNGFYAVQSEASFGNASLISFGYDSGSQVHIIAKQGGQAPLLGLSGSNPQGVFGNWGKIYTEFQKPTAGEVGAVAKAGDTMTGALTVPGVTNTGDYALRNLISRHLRFEYRKNDGTWTTDGYIYKDGVDAPNRRPGVRINCGTPDKDKGNTANSGDWVFGEDGNLTCPKQVVPGSYANFDARYLALSGGTVTGATTFSSTLNIRAGLELYALQPYIDFHFGNSSADYTARIIENTSGNLYVIGSFSASKTITPSDYSNFDARYQAKGSYTPVGEAYTKAQSDARYGVVNGMRRGGQQLYNGSFNWIGNWESPAGCFMTGIKQDGAADGRKMGIFYRQMQYLNKQTNAWVNIGD